MEGRIIDNISPKDIQGQITILSFGLTLDGGTVHLYCENNGKQFNIKLVQHVDFMEPYEDGFIPGALYFNKTLITINSPEEQIIIDALKHCKIAEELYHIKPSKNPLLNEQKTIVFGDDLSRQFGAWRESPGHATELFVKETLEFLTSEEYKKVAIKVGRKI